MKLRGPELWGALVVALLALTVSTHARADSARVPIQLQAQLTARIGTFDRNFKDRAGVVAKVLVIHQNGNTESEVSATGFAKSIVELRIAGLPTAIEESPLVDAATLAARCRALRPALVYFAVGLEQEMAGVATALVGVDVLTVGASAAYAANGAVVGFDVEEARPKLVLNLRSAKAQNVSFKAELLELARIVP